MELTALKQNFSGEIILPGESEYEKASSTFMFKGAPAIIFRPKTSKEVAKAIAYARDNKLLLSIRSGGHSGAGFSTNNGGAVIDLININSIEIIDTEKNLVRIGAGATWGVVAKALREQQLALSSGDTKTVGVGGLTVGGGIGWMVRKFGLAIDSVVSAEVVTQDGKILRASENENSDLFWAIRGGGSNFGIVTYFEFEAKRMQKVFSGMIMYSLDNLSTLLKGWRSYMRIADENLTTILNIFPAFEGTSSVMISCCYAGGDEVAANAAIEPLKKLGTIIKINIEQKEYADVLEDAHPLKDMNIVVKSTFVENFNDEIIDAIVAARDKMEKLILQIRSLGGAMRHISSADTAFSYRNSEVLLISPTFMSLGASKSDIEKALEPWRTIAAFGNGAYANFLSTATPEDVATVFPKETYERLVEVKKKYDPKNLFNQNLNIKPSV